ncbi:MAG: aminomethyl-transferring glycine dehydrogenase subunit GcvPB [Proteobacteria bacterium]|nr:aminomethyl-transferring glycine dehydrogenase subunit GcvPB [Pseudomonadota bacterium]
MNKPMTPKGIVQEELLLWEKGQKGKVGYSMPRPDVESAAIDSSLERGDLDMPDLSEVEVVRHYTRLSQWNFGLDTGMYPLGSCTMKYNPKTNDKQASLPGFTKSHPLLPIDCAQGTLRVMYELEKQLEEITGMDAVSLQPAAGAHGELAGMLIFDAYHKSRNSKRTKILIPDTAHGTNPASAALCGYESIPIASGEDGVLHPEQVRELMDEETAGIMITNPNTLGLFEEHIIEIADIVHEKGGLIYADGANMNAIMGIVKPGKIGVDVMHLNLHKTFSTPHGGGGPGAGPVCVNEKLKPFLPVPRIIKDGDTYRLDENEPQSIGKLHAFYGNVGVLIRAYAYILTMGAEGLKKASQMAVLNANYIMEALKDTFHLPFDRDCMHECVFSDRDQKEKGFTTLDIAKRLIDYGFHPPTIYFPLIVNGALMIEPTETESKEDLDRLIEALKVIVKEGMENPDQLHAAPLHSKRRRLDEVTAARKPCLTGC